MQNELEKLKEENEKLRGSLIDLTFEMNYNKQTEMLEFLRELYASVKTADNKLTKKEILVNLKESLEEFAKNNRISLY
jgi:uncharacterized protein Veg